MFSAVRRPSVSSPRDAISGAVKVARSVGLWSGALVTALYGCRDFTTAPPVTVSLPRLALLCDPDCGARNSTVSGSYDGVIDSLYGGAPELPTPTGSFTFPTFITVRVAGTVNQIPVAAPGDNISLDLTRPDGHQHNPG